jgi:hypothetical protein
MLRIITLLLTIITLFNQIHAQGLLRGNDPLGRSYLPNYGTLLPTIHPSVPPDIGNEVASHFYRCISEGIKLNNQAYYILDKAPLETGGNRNLQGMAPNDLRKHYGNAMVGCQAMIRVEINSYKQFTVEDSVFNKDTKAFSHLKQYLLVEMNMTARYTDVATSKILRCDNFIMNVDSKDYTRLSKLKEEDFLRKKLMDACCNKSQEVFRGLLAGAPIVEKVFEQDGDKAKVVLVNDAPIAAYCQKRASFNVYGIEKFYKVNDQVFPHVTSIGRIEKADDWNYKVSKFSVENGKKDIAEMLGKEGSIVICAADRFPIPTFMPSTERTSVVMEGFKIASSVSLSLGKAKMLKDACLDALASRPLLIDALDRELYDLIEKEKRMQKRVKSDATQGGISIGSELLLTGEIIKYEAAEKIVYYTEEELKLKANPPKKDPKKDPKETPKKDDSKAGGSFKIVSSKPSNIPKFFEYTINLSLAFKTINIETGEEVFQKIYKVGGKAEVPYSKAKESTFNSEMADAIAFKQASEWLTKEVWSDLFYYVTPKLHLLEIAESSKGEAETVIIGGGTMSGFLIGTPLEVVEVTTETIQGEALTREAVIAKLKIKEVREATSICKVKDGGKELLQKKNNGAQLYCKLGYEK